MSIKEDCFHVSKSIKAMELRKSVKELVLSLNVSSGQNIKEDRSHFGYIAEKQNCQFMGYLIVDQKRSLIEENEFEKVPKITAMELDLFRTAHFLMIYICTESIKPIVEKYPPLSQCLNPYIMYDYPPYHKDIDTIINPDMLKPLLNSIIESTPAKIINKAPSELLNKIPAKQYIAVVSEFIKRINAMGVNRSPEDFITRHSLLSTPRPEDVLRNVFYSLIALNQIICNVVQLIYQAFVYDKLYIIDENNTVNIIHDTSHSVGRGLTILTQPNWVDHIPRVNELVLAKIDHKPFFLNTLASVESQILSFSKEKGDTERFELRIVDDELNPYFNLLKP